MYGKSLNESDKTLDILIHEYLYKKSYTGSMKVFKVESGVPDYVLDNHLVNGEYNSGDGNGNKGVEDYVGSGIISNNSGRSLLEEWFKAFNDIWAVRCGNVTEVSNVARIEGILLRLENEKRRHVICRDDESDKYRTADSSFGNKSVDDVYAKGNFKSGVYYSNNEFADDKYVMHEFKTHVGSEIGRSVYDNFYDNKNSGYCESFNRRNPNNYGNLGNSDKKNNFDRFGSYKGKICEPNSPLVSQRGIKSEIDNSNDINQVEFGYGDKSNDLFSRASYKDNFYRNSDYMENNSIGDKQESISSGEFNKMNQYLNIDTNNLDHMNNYEINDINSLERMNEYKKSKKNSLDRINEFRKDKKNNSERINEYEKNNPNNLENISRYERNKNINEYEKIDPNDLNNISRYERNKTNNLNNINGYDKVDSNNLDHISQYGSNKNGNNINEFGRINTNSVDNMPIHEKGISNRINQFNKINMNNLDDISLHEKSISDRINQYNKINMNNLDDISLHEKSISDRINQYSKINMNNLEHINHIKINNINHVNQCDKPDINNSDYTNHYEKNGIGHINQIEEIDSAKQDPNAIDIRGNYAKHDANNLKYMGKYEGIDQKNEINANYEKYDLQSADNRKIYNRFDNNDPKKLLNKSQYNNNENNIGYAQENKIDSKKSSGHKEGNVDYSDSCFVMRNQYNKQDFSSIDFNANRNHNNKYRMSSMRINEKNSDVLEDDDKYIKDQKNEEGRNNKNMYNNGKIDNNYNQQKSDNINTNIYKINEDELKNSFVKRKKRNLSEGEILNDDSISKQYENSFRSINKNRYIKNEEDDKNNTIGGGRKSLNRSEIYETNNRKESNEFHRSKKFVGMSEGTKNLIDNESGSSSQKYSLQKNIFTSNKNINVDEINTNIEDMKIYNMNKLNEGQLKDYNIKNNTNGEDTKLRHHYNLGKFSEEEIKAYNIKNNMNDNDNELNYHNMNKFNEEEFKTYNISNQDNKLNHHYINKFNEEELKVYNIKNQDNKLKYHNMNKFNEEGLKAYNIKNNIKNNDVVLNKGEIDTESKGLKKYSNFSNNNNGLVNIANFRKHNQKITCMQVCSNMQILITGGNDRMINIINVGSMQHEISYEPHSNIITDLRAVEVGTEVLIASSSLDGEIRILRYSRAAQSENPNDSTGEENTVDKNILIPSLESYSSSSYMKMDASVVSIDFTSQLQPITVIAADIDGQMKEWTLEGVLLHSFEVKSIKCFVVVNTNTLLISDRTMVYLYDFRKGIIRKEIIKESANFIFRTFKESKKHIENNIRDIKNYILCMKNKVIVLDSSFNIINTKQSTEKVYSACLMEDESLIIGGYQQIHILKQGGSEVTSIKAHDNIISCLGSGFRGNEEILYSCSYKGDCNVWKYTN